MLSQLQSWGDLKKEFISKEPFKPDSFPKELISMVLPPSVFYPKRPDDSLPVKKSKSKQVLEQITSSRENILEAPLLSERTISLSKIKNPTVKIIKLRDLSENKKRIRVSQEPKKIEESKEIMIPLKNSIIATKQRPKSVMKSRETEKPTITKKLLI